MATEEEQTPNHLQKLRMTRAEEAPLWNTLLLLVLLLAKVDKGMCDQNPWGASPLQLLWGYKRN